MVLMVLDLLKTEQVAKGGNLYTVRLYKQRHGGIAKVIITDDSNKSVWTAEAALETVGDAADAGTDLLEGAGGLWDTALSDLERGHHE